MSMYYLILGILIFVNISGYCQNGCGSDTSTFNVPESTVRLITNINDSVDLVQLRFKNGKMFEEYYEKVIGGRKRLVGSYKRYHTETYNILVEGNYNEKGYKEGKWIWYHANGIKVCENTFYNDSFLGDYLEYYDSGALKVKGKIDTATCSDVFYTYKEGIWEYYYPNGTIQETGAYSRMAESVECEHPKLIISFLLNEVTCLTFPVVSLKDSIWKRYNTEGNSVETQTYSKGKILADIINKYCPK